MLNDRLIMAQGETRITMATFAGYGFQTAVVPMAGFQSHSIESIGSVETLRVLRYVLLSCEVHGSPG